MTLPRWHFTQLWTTLKEGDFARSTLKLALAKPGVLGPFCRKLRAVSDETRRNGATTGASVATLGNTGARCNKPRGLSAAVDRQHNLLLKGSSGGARATDYYTGNVGGSFAAAGIASYPGSLGAPPKSLGTRLLLQGLEPGSTIAVVHDLLLQASQQLAVTGLAKCQRHWLLQRR